MAHRATKLPRARFSTLFHRGFLDRPAYETQLSSSHEGNLLSCSPHEEADEAWLGIAKLGGRPRWRLTKLTGFCVLDHHSLSKLQRRELLARAHAYGAFHYSRGLRVDYYDDEHECDRYTIFLAADKAEALSTADENSGKLRGVRVLLAAPLLISYWNSRHGGKSLDLAATADAALAYVIDCDYPRFDGIFWNDDLDEMSLSAPRVGLFQRTLSRCKRRPA